MFGLRSMFSSIHISCLLSEDIVVQADRGLRSGGLRGAKPHAQAPYARCHMVISEHIPVGRLGGSGDFR